MNKNKAIQLVGLSFAIVLAACSSTASLQQQYYILGNNSKTNLTMVSGVPNVSIRRVGVPEYLNQRGIAREITPETINISKTEFWAEPLSESLPTILAQEIAVYQQAPVEVHPLPPGISVDTIVEVEISHFVADSQQLTLQAAYRLIKRDKLERHQFSTSVNINGGKTTMLVKAYNQALQALAQDISTHLQLREKSSRTREHIGEDSIKRQ